MTKDCVFAVLQVQSSSMVVDHFHCEHDPAFNHHEQGPE